MAEGIQEVDWAPDGTTMLVVRDVGGKSRIEFPMGKVLYETTGHVSYARLSPKGDRIAFLDHAFPLDDAGTVAVIDLSGKKTTLTGQWASEHGLAWAPSGREIWFTATEAGANRSLYAVTLSGKLRVVTRVPGRTEAPRHREERQGAPHAREPAGRNPRHAPGRHAGARHVVPRLLVRGGPLAPTARLLLFDEEGEAGGANYTVYLRKSDRSPVVRLGEGNALALSPDGKWALSILPVPNSPFRLLPTGTGEHRELALSGVSAEQAATWFADSKRILFAASEAGHGAAALRAGDRRRETAADHAGGDHDRASGLRRLAGREVRRGDRRRPQGRALSGGGRRGAADPGASAGEFPLRFSPDGRALYVWKRGDVPARVTRVDLESGKREAWKDLMPADPAGVERISNVLVTPDGKGYAYCYARLLSDLFVVEGLK